MQLQGWDYVKDTPIDHSGLASLATLIKAARAEARAAGHASILLDNGDLFQGGPLGAALADMGDMTDHPLIKSLHALQYDAVGLGNHDLDYGLDYVRAYSAQLQMPLISTNLEIADAPEVSRGTILTVETPGDNGAGTAPLRIGVLSALPENTAIWNAHILDGKARVLPAASSVTAHARELRKQGAHIIILLAHMGIHTGQTDSALALAEQTGVDAIITGHTHRRFPGHDHTATPGVNTKSGLLGSCPAVPAVMPGHNGSDLAMLDLDLAQDQAGTWQRVSHHSRLVRNDSNVLAAPEILSFCADHHTDLRRRLAKPVGTVSQTLHTYFALARPGPVSEILARAKIDMIRDALAGTPDAAFPLLATTSAHTSGGIEGPGHYLCIPPGQVLRRHLAGLAPYTNEIWALRLNGATLRRWLENAAQIYTHLAADVAHQPLTDPAVPAFNFDTIHGLTYIIDPSQPIGSRIVSLCHAGSPLSDEQVFTLATNQFRASGGGGLLARSEAEVIYRSDRPLLDAMADVLETSPSALWGTQPPWRLKSETPLQAMLETAPDALPHLHEIADLAPQYLEQTAEGFARIQITL